jgi:Family of unknown function (DUF6152)
VNASVRKLRMLVVGALSLLLGAAAAVAHHSTAMFDMQHTVTIQGTVTQFDWTNPHTFIFMEVLNTATGTSESWSVEGMSPNYLSRNGWTRHTLNAGDKIGMEVHLLKDGRKGGFCATVTLPDGKKLANLPPRPSN